MMTSSASLIDIFIDGFWPAVGFFAWCFAVVWFVAKCTGRTMNEVLDDFDLTKKK